MGISETQMQGYANALAEFATLSFSDTVLFPLELVHQVHIINTKSIDVPTFSGFTMSATTGGNAQNADTTSNTITNVNIQPSPRFVKTTVAEVDQLQNEFWLRS